MAKGKHGAVFVNLEHHMYNSLTMVHSCLREISSVFNDGSEPVHAISEAKGQARMSSGFFSAIKQITMMDYSIMHMILSTKATSELVSKISSIPKNAGKLIRPNNPANLFSERNADARHLKSIEN
jgi:hypothetical protein